MVTEAQHKAYLELKAEGALDDISEFKATVHEIYIHHIGGDKITAIHESGLITIHHHKKA